jgi:hypothetical protein
MNQEPQADPRLHQARLNICARCPDRISRPLVPDLCRRCGCILALKTRLKSQRCPKGLW